MQRIPKMNNDKEQSSWNEQHKFKILSYLSKEIFMKMQKLIIYIFFREF